MAPLGRHHLDDLLAACDHYARQHRELDAILEDLCVTVPSVREALNQIALLTSKARDRRMAGVIGYRIHQELFPPVRAALNRLARLLDEPPATRNPQVSVAEFARLGLMWKDESHRRGQPSTIA